MLFEVSYHRQMTTDNTWTFITHETLIICTSNGHIKYQPMSFRTQFNRTSELTGAEKEYFNFNLNWNWMSRILQPDWMVFRILFECELFSKLGAINLNYLWVWPGFSDEKSMRSGLNLCMMAQKARPSLHASVMLVMLTPGYPLVTWWHQVSSPATPVTNILQLNLCSHVIMIQLHD